MGLTDNWQMAKILTDNWHAKNMLMPGGQPGGGGGGLAQLELTDA